MKLVFIQYIKTQEHSSTLGCSHSLGEKYECHSGRFYCYHFMPKVDCNLRQISSSVVCQRNWMLKTVYVAIATLTAQNILKMANWFYKHQVYIAEALASCKWNGRGI